MSRIGRVPVVGWLHWGIAGNFKPILLHGYLEEEWGDPFLWAGRSWFATGDGERVWQEIRVTDLSPHP